MKIKVRRQTRTKDAFLGVLEVDGSFNCYSMENLLLSIPTGTYSVEITYSPDFHRAMPLLDGVPGRIAVRIHPANWPGQLKGCIAVGQSHDADDLNNSQKAFDPLFKQIEDALKADEAVMVEVADETQPNPVPLPSSVLPLPVPRQGNLLSQGISLIGMLFSLLKLK